MAQLDAWHFVKSELEGNQSSEGSRPPIACGGYQLSHASHVQRITNSFHMLPRSDEVDWMQLSHASQV